MEKTFETPQIIQPSLIIGATQAEGPVMAEQRPGISTGHSLIPDLQNHEIYKIISMSYC